MSKSGSISTFILGGLVGAAIGVLFAPRPGYETREILVDRALDYYENVDVLYDNASDRAVELYSTSRDVAMDATEQVRAKIEAARARLMEEVEAATEKAKEEVAELPDAVEVDVEVVEEKPKAAAKVPVKKAPVKKTASDGAAVSAKAKA